MKKLFAIAMALCLLFSLSACEEDPQTNEEQIPLMTMYVVAEQKNYSNGELTSTSAFEYDAWGRPVKVEWVSKEGDLRRSELTYDEHGNRTQELFTVQMSGNTVVNQYDYDLTYQEGQLTHCDCSQNGNLVGGMDLHYDEKGNLVLVQYDETYTENRFLCWHTFEYDAEGRLIRETQCKKLPMGEKQYGYYLYRVDYSYDSNGNLSFYSLSSARTDTPVAHNETQDITFTATRDQYAFACDQDGYLIYIGSTPDAQRPEDPFSVFDEVGEGVVLDENSNLVRIESDGVVETEYVYKAIEVTETEKETAKQLMHGVSESMMPYAMFANMNPAEQYLIPIILSVPQLYSPFYYLVPYPVW